MKPKLVLTVAMLVSLPAPAHAHRLDEYLQATIFTVEKDHVQGFLRLVPGVAVAPSVIASIDTDGDGKISQSERQVYVQRVLHDLSLSVDGRRLEPRLISSDFSEPEELKEGLGEIQITFSADVPNVGINRKLVFENRHQTRISAFLVNALVPHDKNIQITAQSRNENQSFYQLDYMQNGGAMMKASSKAPLRLWLSALLFLASGGVPFWLWRRRVPGT